MNVSSEMLPQKSSVERQAVITNRLLFEIAGCRESTFRIHEQTEFAFLVRISHVQELLPLLGNRHHGPQVYRLAPQCGFGTLWVHYPLKADPTSLGGLAD